MDMWGFGFKAPHQPHVVELKVKAKFIEQVREL
jgi:hypothetical protein